MANVYFYKELVVLLNVRITVITKTIPQKSV